MKRVITLLLAVMLMAGLLAGCGGGGEETPSTEPTAGTSSLPSFEAPSEAPDDVSAEIELPLVEDTYTFDYWLPCRGFDDFATYDDNLFFQWMEDQTNVHINFMHPPAGNERENFQTMYLSNDYPDFVQDLKNYYEGGMDKAISDGFILRLNDYVDQYMPNYRAVVYRDEETFVQCITDTGNLWAIHRICDVPQGAADGLGIREDWLERAGLTVEDCETVDQLGEVLKVFKDYTYDNEGPLWLANNGISGVGALNGAYNITSPTWNVSGFMNKDGVATYSPLEPGMKEYVAQIAEWYGEGLVNRNYITDAGWAVPEDRWGNGEVGVGEFCYVNEGIFAAAAAASALQPDPDFSLAALTTPKVDASQDWATDVHIRATQDVVQSGNSCGITTQCSNIELACKWWDYQWTDEGKEASNWGPYLGEKGDTNATYYIDPDDTNGDGHQECYQPWLLDKYGSVYFIQVKVARHVAPNWNVWSKEWSVLDKKAIGFIDTWEKAGCDWWWPASVTLTAEEGAEVSSILTNCSTYFNEWTAKVVTGEKSIDTYDTELVPHLKDFNIARATEIYQAALDRYMERTKFLSE